jgi:transposase, IS5 family
VLRTVNDQPPLWDAILPSELLVLPDEWAWVDRLLDDQVFVAPLRVIFRCANRSSVGTDGDLSADDVLEVPPQTGCETLCREMGDSISWQRFCRIPFGTRVPHPTTLMKLTRRCGDAAVTGLDDALLAKAAEHKLLRTDKVRADTTVVQAAVA